MTVIRISTFHNELPAKRKCCRKTGLPLLFVVAFVFICGGFAAETERPTVYTSAGQPTVESEQLIAAIPAEATLPITATERQLMLWPTEEAIKKHAICRDRSEEIPNVYRNGDRKSKPIKYGARNPETALRDAEYWISKVIKPEWIVEDLKNKLAPIQAEDASKSSILCRWELEDSIIQVTQTQFNMWVVIQPVKVQVLNSSAEEFVSSVLDKYLIHGDDMTSIGLRPLEITSEKDINLFIMNRDGSKPFPPGAIGNWWGHWRLVYTDKTAVAMLFWKIDVNSMASFGPDDPWF